MSLVRDDLAWKIWLHLAQSRLSLIHTNRSPTGRPNLERHPWPPPPCPAPTIASFSPVSCAASPGPARARAPASASPPATPTPSFPPPGPRGRPPPRRARPHPPLAGSLTGYSRMGCRRARWPSWSAPSRALAGAKTGHYTSSLLGRTSRY
jgi:hypothetical protein